MPRGPRGEKRPADVIGNAVHVMRIATGEIQDSRLDAGKEYARKGGLKGGKARAAKLSKKERARIAKKAAEVRWQDSKIEEAPQSAFTVSRSRTIRHLSPKNQIRKR